MLAERRRVLLQLGDRSLAPFWLGRLLERVGDWLILLALLGAAWSFTAQATLPAWVLAMWVAPRLLLSALYGGRPRRTFRLDSPLIAVVRAAAIGGFLLAARVLPEYLLLLGLAGAMGFASALAAETREDALRTRLSLAQLGVGAAADAVVQRTALVIGAVVAAIVLYASSPAAAALAAIAAFLGTAVLYLSARAAPAQAARALSPRSPVEPIDRGVARAAAIYLVVAFTTGALGAALIVVTLPLAGSNLDSAALAPAFLAFAGLGMLLGPLPVARLLLRVPAPVLLLGTIAATSAAALVVAVTQSAALGLGAFFVFGLASVTQDSLRAIALRRLAPRLLYNRITRLSWLALTVGQIYGVAVIIIASLDTFAILGLLAVSQVVLVGASTALGGRTALEIGGLSSLPIKSVVHKLSWDTRPPAATANFTGSAPRVRRLAKWINRHVIVERLEVQLPISKRVYEIYRPDEASRERLFEQGRADPDKQMPYWAKVWPSGVALADVVVERKSEVADKHVLELGAGLGVTAAAVLECGGHIVTADYSALPLAHCRLNALVNTDRAASATCFNWRRDAEVTTALGQPEFRAGFPLIIAGDVLYEGRDAEPLLNVIERLLDADGTLWLAEPVRRTAQRFLDSAASLGWEIDSRQVRADWPDATSGPVNLHFLTRSPESDRIVADMGGWRI